MCLQPGYGQGTGLHSLHCLRCRLCSQIAEPPPESGDVADGSTPPSVEFGEVGEGVLAIRAAKVLTAARADSGVRLSGDAFDGAPREPRVAAETRLLEEAAAREKASKREAILAKFQGAARAEGLKQIEALEAAPPAEELSRAHEDHAAAVVTPHELREAELGDVELQVARRLARVCARERGHRRDVL